MPNSFLRRLLTRPFRNRQPVPIRNAARPVGRPIETLEDRTVPAVLVSFAANTRTFTGDAVGDTVLVQSTATPGSVQYNAGGLGLTTQVGVNSVVYNAGGGDDILVIANPLANILTPLTPGIFNITFNGGGDAGDELDYVGGASTWTSSYDATGLTAGTVNFTNTPGTQTERTIFTGVPTIRNSMTAANINVTSPATNDDIRIFAGPVAFTATRGVST